MYGKVPVTQYVKQEAETEATIYDDYKVGEDLGGFSGYVRNSKPTKGHDGKSGVMCQIFGEDGPNADLITALSLTKFLYVPVKVTIHAIKDKNGILLKKNKKYPKICEFIGLIHRSKPMGTGMLTQIFGEEGGNADAVYELNKSANLDTFVHVRLQLAEKDMLPSEIETDDQENQLEELSKQLTPKEIKELAKKQEKYRSADDLLSTSGFYNNEQVVRSLGTIEDYKNWLTTQPCLVDQCDNEAVAFDVSYLGSRSVYPYVSLCQEHINELQSGSNIGFVDPLSYLVQMNRVQISKFAKYQLKEKLNIPQDYYVEPSRVYRWAYDNGLGRAIPKAYEVLI